MLKPKPIRFFHDCCFAISLQNASSLFRRLHPSGKFCIHCSLVKEIREGESFGLLPGGFAELWALLLKGAFESLFNLCIITFRRKNVQMLPSVENFGVIAIPKICNMQF